MTINELMDIEKKLISSVGYTDVKWLIDLAKFEIDKERYKQAEFLLNIGIRNLKKCKRNDLLEMGLIYQQQARISEARGEDKKTNNLFSSMKNIYTEFLGKEHSDVKKLMIQ